MSVDTLRTIVLVLLVISGGWLIRVLAKRETENIVRSLLVCAALGGVLVYLQNQKVERLTLKDVRAQIKETFFPEKAPNYVYQKDEGTDAAGHYLRYFFESPGPRLSLELDPTGKFFNIKDVAPINRVLAYLGLPKVERPVRELAAVTGSPNDIDHYRWDDYSLGVLTIVRDICQDRDQLESYQCISNIFIARR